MTKKTIPNINQVAKARTEINLPWNLWLIRDGKFSTSEWEIACAKAKYDLETLISINKYNLSSMVSAILTESWSKQIGENLGISKKIYYSIKPYVPRSFFLKLRRKYQAHQETSFSLNWPIEERYTNFQIETLNHLLLDKQVSKVPYLMFWPNDKEFAFTITHDIETAEGQEFVRKLADVDEKHGFRSSFNFVPERYPIDMSLFKELESRGFEVGVHDLRHDGKLYWSKRVFLKGAEKINAYIEDWGVSGFRSAYTHRHPQWMQALNVKYDSSFFDTDPYEPIPGGVMSIWPFFMGNFVELPMTLAQDHTLIVIQREKTPSLWLKKVDYIKKFGGLALINVHPDYMIKKENLNIYEQFLSAMSERRGYYWHALPRDVAKWWQKRALAGANNHQLESIGDAKVSDTELTVGTIVRNDSGDISFSPGAWVT